MHLGPSPLLRPCNGVAVLPSGQARVGACKEGVQMHVERVRKCTGLKKKKKSNKKQKQKQKTKNGLTHTKMPSSTGLACVMHVQGFGAGVQRGARGWCGNNGIQTAMGVDVVA